MKNHLSKFNLINNVSSEESFDDNIVFDKISSVTIFFDNKEMDSITLNQISDIVLLDNDRLMITDSSFSKELYDAYIQEKIVYLINVSGICINITNYTQLIDFETSFKGYQFENINGSISTEGKWKYILKRIES